MANRRTLNRVVYPCSARPKLLNIPAKIINISEKGLQLGLEYDFAKKNQIDLDKEMELEIEFHHGEKVKVSGKVVNTYTDINNIRTNVSICLSKTIPRKIVAREQAYVLKHFPDFCRVMKLRDKLAAETQN